MDDDELDTIVIESNRIIAIDSFVPREHVAPRPQNVVNLTEALCRIITQEKVASASPKKRRKRIEGQGEMPLPIPGKKGKEAMAKPIERPSARRKKPADFAKNWQRQSAGGVRRRWLVAAPSRSIHILTNVPTLLASC